MKPINFVRIINVASFFGTGQTGLAGFQNEHAVDVLPSAENDMQIYYRKLNNEI